MCSFIDKLPTEEEKAMPKSKLHKAFCDQEGAMNLQQIVELATALPEAIKSVPVDQLQELLPALQQIIEAAKSVIPEEEMTPMEEETPTEEMSDEGEMPNEEEKKPSFSDADMKAFTDKAIRQHAAVIEKARGFLAETYAFADKSTEEIMRDALATVDNTKFSNTELPLAFKLLKKPDADYSRFADSQPGSLSTILKDKEL